MSSSLTVLQSRQGTQANWVQMADPTVSFLSIDVCSFEYSFPEKNWILGIFNKPAKRVRMVMARNVEKYNLENRRMRHVVEWMECIFEKSAVVWYAPNTESPISELIVRGKNRRIQFRWQIIFAGFGSIKLRRSLAKNSSKCSNDTIFANLVGVGWWHNVPWQGHVFKVYKQAKEDRLKKKKIQRPQKRERAGE